MKSLTLYIDKWYIIAAVCTNGVPKLVTPSNREDRFWLYFYDGGDNDTVVYGKDNKRKFLTNTLHYYGDVFNLITDDCHFYALQPKAGNEKNIPGFGYIG